MRLRRAALELFRERGYDRTTAAEIAARAGVTERTFFRQFPDKREALFGGEATLRAAMTASIAEAPEGMAPLDALRRAFSAALPALEEHRPFSEPWYAVVSATPALRERELAKTAALADALAAAWGRGASRTCRPPSPPRPGWPPSGTRPSCGSSSRGRPSANAWTQRCAS